MTREDKERFARTTVQFLLADDPSAGVVLRHERITNPRLATFLSQLAEEGILREGVTGFWLPHRPDPGTVRVVETILDEEE